MSTSVQIRSATEDDVQDILDVLRAALGEPPLLKRTPELFRWKHFENPFGRSLLLVAEVAGRIVGVRALMRWRLTTPAGDSVSCVRAVDTATHPEFQGLGIFRSLTMSAVEEARLDGVDLIFNTPNQQSGPGYLKMGWNEVGRIRPLVRPRPGRAPAATDGKIEIDELLSDVQEVFPGRAPAREPVGLRTPRTDEYQAWRFRGHPTARYWWAPVGQGGAIVRASVRNGRTELLISDLAGGPEVVRSLARRHRARYLGAAFTEVTPEYAAARSARMFRPPGIDGLLLVANPLTDVAVDVLDIASWDLSMSDLELL